MVFLRQHFFCVCAMASSVFRALRLSCGEGREMGGRGQIAKGKQEESSQDNMAFKP